MKYNEETVLCGETIKLTREEQEEVEKYHKSRIAFTFLKDGSLALNENDPREHRIYLQEDFGDKYDDSQFDELIRGYLKPGRIVFYTGGSFHTPVDSIPDEYLLKMKLIAYQKYGDGIYQVWNGVDTTAPIGTNWPPILTVSESRLFNSVEILDHIWVTQFMNPNQIGIIKAMSLYTGDINFYVGSVSGMYEDANINTILLNGGKLHISILRSFLDI